MSPEVDPQVPSFDPARGGPGADRPLWGPPRRAAGDPPMAAPRQAYGAEWSPGASDPEATTEARTAFPGPVDARTVVTGGDPTLVTGDRTVVTGGDSTVAYPRQGPPPPRPDPSTGPVVGPPPRRLVPPDPRSTPARRPAVVIGIAVTVAVLLGALVWGAVALMTPAPGPPAVAAATATRRPPPPSTTVAATTLPSTANGLVRLGPSAASSPAGPAVLALLGRHFTAINTHDYTGWMATVSPRRAQAQPQASWLQAYRSTTDDDVLVSAITQTPQGLDVTLSFTSHQDVADAPPDLQVGTICWQSRWPVVGGRIDVPPQGTTTKAAC